MFLHVTSATWLGDYRVQLAFSDGSEGEIDLENSLEGPIFEPLKDKTLFGKFCLEGHTICWKNGADFASEYLHEILHSKAAT